MGDDLPYGGKFYHLSWGRAIGQGIASVRMRYLLTIIILAGCGGSGGDGTTAPDTGVDAGPDLPDADEPGCTADIDCASGLCIDGECVDLVCRPGELSCGGDDIVVQCNPDGLEFTTVETCEDGFRCHRGVCREQVCEPRTVECEGAAQRICNEAGTRAELRPCGGQRVCVRGQCLDPQCDDGAVECQDPRTRRICEGQAWRMETCAGDARCDAGVCTPFFEVAANHITAIVARPVEGAIAVWITPTAELPGPELVVWGPLIVELSADGVRVVFDGVEVLASQRPFEAGVPSHVVISWTVGRARLWRDGFDLGDASIPAIEGGDVLEMFPGDWRIGSLAIGRAPRGDFVPTCDDHGLRSATLWSLDEGAGDRVVASDGTGLALADPSWQPGTLPVYGADSDEDGWGWIHETAPGCEPRDSGYVLRVGDCNDEDAAISPAAPEIPDGTDNDCDGETDE